ncbi:MAG: hypothetical protein R2861_10900 [Desulfobacterales bacterium]
MHFTNTLCDREGIEIKGFASDFFDVLKAYYWPGNVRELKHTMEQVITVAEPDPLPRHLPTPIRVHHAKSVLKTNENKSLKTISDSDSGATFSKVKGFPAMPPYQMLKNNTSAT